MTGNFFAFKTVEPNIAAVAKGKPAVLFAISILIWNLDLSSSLKFIEEGSDICGSGNPKNLTILFKQKTNSLGNKLYCDTQDNSAGGVDIGVKKSIDLTESSFDNDNLPGSSIFR